MVIVFASILLVRGVWIGISYFQEGRYRRTDYFDDENQAWHALIVVITNASNLHGECSSCGALYTKSCACSKGGFVDKFVRDPNKTTDSPQRPPHNCPKCGNPVDGQNETEELKPIINLLHGSSIKEKRTKEQRSG
nr:protein short hypocotyl in white light 1 [Tanacetum cinerariifolium]